MSSRAMSLSLFNFLESVLYQFYWCLLLIMVFDKSLRFDRGLGCLLVIDCDFIWLHCALHDWLLCWVTDFTTMFFKGRSLRLLLQVGVKFLVLLSGHWLLWVSISICFIVLDLAWIVDLVSAFSNQILIHLNLALAVCCVALLLNLFRCSIITGLICKAFCKLLF